MANDFDGAILWAERTIHRMPRWYLAHLLLVASCEALSQSEVARAAVEACRAVLGGISAQDAERLPLRDAARMRKFLGRLRAVGL
jgi:hypothetical protein